MPTYLSIFDYLQKKAESVGLSIVEWDSADGLKYDILDIKNKVFPYDEERPIWIESHDGCIVKATCLSIGDALTILNIIKERKQSE